MAEPDDYPMNRAPRCTATPKRTGQPCRAPAVRGWRVCRFHGARGGSKAGREANAHKHGMRTAEAVAERKALNDLLRGCRASFTDL